MLEAPKPSALKVKATHHSSLGSKMKGIYTDFKAIASSIFTDLLYRSNTQLSKSKTSVNFSLSWQQTTGLIVLHCFMNKAHTLKAYMQCCLIIT